MTKMIHMDPETIDTLTFAQFAMQFSRGEISGSDGFNPDVEPELHIRDRADMVLGSRGDDKLFYAGPISDVDSAFSLIAALEPERAFLYGGSEREIAYLGFRLCLFANANYMSQYYLNLLNATEDEKKEIWTFDHSKELIRKVEEFDIPVGRSAVQGTKFFEALGYTNIPPSATYVMYDPLFKKSEALKGVIKIVETADTDDFRHTWLFPNNYRKVRDKALMGNIYGIGADFPDGLARAIGDLAKIYDINELALNVRKDEQSSPEEHLDNLGRLYQKVSDSVKRVHFM